MSINKKPYQINDRAKVGDGYSSYYWGGGDLSSGDLCEAKDSVNLNKPIIANSTALTMVAPEGLTDDRSKVIIQSTISSSRKPVKIVKV